MTGSPLTEPVLWQLGPLVIGETVVTTWVLIAAVATGCRLATRRLQRLPGRMQTALELAVNGIESQIAEIAGGDARRLLPLVGTLFVFLVAANLSGLLPGVHAPTARLETPTALALLVFAAVHYYGIRAHGPLGYLARFARPKAIMLPLNLLAEVTRTFSMMVRLFGNVMSGEFVIALIAALAGLLVPVPLMALELLLGLVQAYIFTILATVFIAAAVGDGEGA